MLPGKETDNGDGRALTEPGNQKMLPGKETDNEDARPLTKPRNQKTLPGTVRGRGPLARSFSA